MNYFTESGLTFGFPNTWHVIKYDDHPFYKSIGGQGLRGVDFLIIKDLEHLTLLEVKNFKDRFKADGVNPTETFFDNQTFYLEAFADKFQDTIQGIRVIHKYYSRKWWFRNLAMPLSNLLPKKYWFNYDWGMWWLAYQLLNDHKIELQVCLEWDNNKNLYLDSLNLAFANFLKKNHFDLPQNIKILHYPDLLSSLSN